MSNSLASRFAVFAVASLAILPALVAGHSWNEQISLIGDNGSFVANGYPRGYVARTDPGYNGNSMMYLIPTAETKRIHIDQTDMLCHPSQRTQTQSPKYPRLTVAPGSAIAMKGLENGHVTLIANQPGKQKKGGTVLIFGTTSPKADEKLMDVLQWTADGSGGDKRGKLIQTQDFDDNRCHQINGGAVSVQRQAQFPDHVPGQPTSNTELWCQHNAVIPKDAPIGKLYTLYWIWQWPTMPTDNSGFADGKDEYYTTCSDYDVGAHAKEDGILANTLVQQDPMPTPVSDYKSRTALVSQVYTRGVAGALAAPSGAAAAPTPTPAPAPAPVASSPVVSSAQVQAPAPAQAVASPAATGANLTPLPLAAYRPVSSTSAAAAPAPIPTGSPLPASMFDPVSTKTTVSPVTPAPSAAASTPAASGNVVITVPAGAPVFMVNGGKIVTLAKRAPVAEAKETGLPSVVVGREAVVRHARSHLGRGKGFSAKVRGQ